MVMVERLRTLIPNRRWHCKSQNRIKAGQRNALTNSSSPLTKVTQNVTTKTELGRQLAFGGIHLVCIMNVKVCTILHLVCTS